MKLTNVLAPTTYTHCNAAGASPPSPSTLAAQTIHLNLEASVGGYDAARLALDSTENLYTSFATLVHADRDEIAVLDSSTTALAYGIYGVRLSPDDILISASSEEYAAKPPRVPPRRSCTR